MVDEREGGGGEKGKKGREGDGRKRGKKVGGGVRKRRRGGGGRDGGVDTRKSEMRGVACGAF